MSNKPFTREIVDICTDQLCVFGFQRKRRGLAIQRLNSEMTLGLCISHRDHASGSVDLQICGFVFWVPVERIYAAGRGKTYRFTETVTQTRMFWPPSDGGPPYLFEPGLDPQPNLSRLVAEVQTVALPAFAGLADPDGIVSETADLVPMGGGFPEKYLALRMWQEKTAVLTAEFENVISKVPKGVIAENVTAFYECVQHSISVAKLFENKG